MENSKPYTIVDVLDQLNKKTSCDLLHYYYIRDIIHNILDLYQKSLDSALDEDTKKVCMEVYENVFSLLSNYIANML